MSDQRANAACRSDALCTDPSCTLDYPHYADHRKVDDSGPLAGVVLRVQPASGKSGSLRVLGKEALGPLPAGYEYTGEFRHAKPGEYFLNGQHVEKCESRTTTFASFYIVRPIACATKCSGPCVCIDKPPTEKCPHGGPRDIGSLKSITLPEFPDVLIYPYLADTDYIRGRERWVLAVSPELDMCAVGESIPRVSKALDAFCDQREKNADTKWKYDQIATNFLLFQQRVVDLFRKKLISYSHHEEYDTRNPKVRVHKFTIVEEIAK